MSNLGWWKVAIAVLLVALSLSGAIGACGGHDYSGYAGTWVGTGSSTTMLGLNGSKVTCVITKNGNDWSAQVTWDASYQGIFASGTHHFVAQDGKLVANDGGSASWGWLRLDGSKLVYEFPAARGSSQVITLAEFSRQ